MARNDEIQKELLIDLLEEEKALSRYMTDDERRAALADYLLQNNVVVLPCKVGDTIYRVDLVYRIVREQIVTGYTHDGKRLRIRAIDKKKTKAKYKDNYIAVGEYKRHFFLTKKEAEERLSEKGENKQ